MVTLIEASIKIGLAAWLVTFWSGITAWQFVFIVSLTALVAAGAVAFTYWLKGRFTEMSAQIRAAREDQKELDKAVIKALVLNNSEHKALEAKMKQLEGS
jgi:hypothetical protein